jgi:hypothetical protein
MASKLLRQFLQGAITGENAALTGKRLASTEAEQKRIQRNKDIFSMLLGQSQINKNNAEAYRSNNPRPVVHPLQHGFAPDGAEYNYDPNTGETKFTGRYYTKSEDNHPKISISPKGWSATGVEPDKAKLFAIQNDLPWNTMLNPVSQPPTPKPMTQDQIARTKKDILNMTALRFIDTKNTIPNQYYGKSDSLFQDWSGQNTQPATTPTTLGSLTNIATGGGITPQIQPMPKPDNTFHGATTYQEAVDGITHNFTGAEADTLLQDAKRFFGVR